MVRTCRCLSCITPPHLLRKLLESQDQVIRQTALNTLLTTARLRGERSVRSSLTFASAPTDGRRTIFDCQNSSFLQSAVIARTEQGQASADDSVNRAFEGFGTTREFYKEVFGRNSIDDRGMRLDGYVHRGTNYNNAFWDGQEMVFGDGDGRVFTDFTKSLDVIAHELAHGVTENAAGLEYHTEPGALNESMSDVFGSLVKQWSLGQTADQADWLIGAEVFTPGIGADALRSMKAPGKAYNNDLLGRDPQPDHISKFARLPDTEEGDWGGVHINSGIPNRAFYLTAVDVGGYAWEAPGHIWYESLKASGVKTQFQDFADTTHAKAGQLYGAGSAEQQAVLAAWREVGIRISGVPAGGGAGTGRGRRAGSGGGAGREGDTLAALTRQIEALSAQVKALAKDVDTLKGKG
jgi:Zn-dependent metalloprotease